MGASKTSQEIRQLIDELQQAKINIKQQVDAAKRDFASGGEAADRDWLLRAEYALRQTGRDIQFYQSELGRVRKIENEAKARRFERRFVDEARAYLSPHDFKEIMDRVHATKEQPR